MDTLLSSLSRPYSDLDMLTLKCVTSCESIIGSENVQYWLSPPCAERERDVAPW